MLCGCLLSLTIVSLLLRDVQVLVPIANGSEEMEVVILVDVLRRAGFKVIVASVEKELQILASRNVKIVADQFLRDVPVTEIDMIILPVSFGQPLLFTYGTGTDDSHFLAFQDSGAFLQNIFTNVLGSTVLFGRMRLLFYMKLVSAFEMESIDILFCSI